MFYFCVIVEQKKYNLQSVEQKFNDNLPGVSFRMNTIDIFTRKSFVFEETGYERDFDNQIVVKSIIEL